jgi:hypothetical protein
MKCDGCDGLGEVPDPEVGSSAPRRPRGYLERGWRKQWLLGKLARSEGTHRDLAQALGVVPSAVGMFARRHEAEVEALREALAQQLTGLWIADKLSRLAEMQTDVEDINNIIADKIEAATPSPVNPLEPGDERADKPSATEDLPVWLRTKLSILRGAAEELGQIPNKVTMQVGGSIVTYKIDGVDLDQI